VQLDETRGASVPLRQSRRMTVEMAAGKLSVSADRQAAAADNSKQTDPSPGSPKAGVFFWAGLATRYHCGTETLEQNAMSDLALAFEPGPSFGGEGAALLFGLPLWRVEFCGEPKPIFSDQEPGVDIF
jgi:hypothetical protein